MSQTSDSFHLDAKKDLLQPALHGDSRPDISGDAVQITKKTKQFFGEDVELGSILTPGGVEDQFKIKELLGVGRFGEVDPHLKTPPHIHVRKGVHKQTNRKCALKFVDKAETSHRQFLREAKLIRRLGRHPNIIEFMGVYVNRDDTHYVLATEYAAGGCLTNFVGLDVWTAYSEAEICIMLYQIACAVSHMHRHRVVHCDIKHENFVSIDRFDVSSAKALKNHALKLTDFGCAVEVLPKTMKVGGGGTVVYMAPERLRGESFSFPADIWSVGVIFYSLLTSRLPFFGRNEAEVLSQVEREEWRGQVMDRTDVSKEAVDLLGSMLEQDPRKRITADEILRTDWVNGLAPATEPVRETIEHLRKSYLRLKFRVMVRTAMAGNRLKLVLSAIHSEKLTLQLLHYLSTPDQIRKLSAALYAHATPPGSEWITKAAFVSTLMSLLPLRTPRLASELFDSSLSASSLHNMGSSSSDSAEFRRGSRTWKLVFDAYAASPLVRKKSSVPAFGRPGAVREEPRINHLVFCLSVASKLSVSTDERLGLAFELFDMGHLGYIDFGEYRSIVRTLFYGGVGSRDDLLGRDDEDIRAEFDMADRDKDGKLNKDEFIDAGKTNPHLRRYFHSINRILPRKQSVFLREDAVIRETQQGMLRVRTRGILRQSKWHERMCAVSNGRLGLWKNYEAFVSEKPESTVTLGRNVRVDVRGMTPAPSPIPQHSTRGAMACAFSSVLESTAEADETDASDLQAAASAPAMEHIASPGRAPSNLSRLSTKTSLGTVDGALGPRLTVYNGKRLVLKIEADSPDVLRAWADVLKTNGATVVYGAS